MGRPRCWRFWPIGLLLVLGGCEQAEKLQDSFRDLTPYEEYQALLTEAGLDGTALAKDWTRAVKGTRLFTDLFAPRGTPVLAASAGRVRGVRETSRGGKVVWIRDPVREASLYYAHLDSQHVNDGQMVKRGDTVGFVGNTGNARGTPPHLHFGLYRRGPVDPYPFLDPPRRTRGGGVVPELTADLALLGVRVRPVNEGIRLRAAPGRRGEIVREPSPGTRLQVLGASGESTSPTRGRGSWRRPTTSESPPRTS